MVRCPECGDPDAGRELVEDRTIGRWIMLVIGLNLLAGITIMGGTQTGQVAGAAALGLGAVASMVVAVRLHRVGLAGGWAGVGDRLMAWARIGMFAIWAAIDAAAVWFVVRMMR